jgi:hypothetical chaperone protein
VPSGVYHDLATWHLINTVYTPQRVAELRGMRAFYATAAHHERLMTVLDLRLGHELAARAEAAKIAVAAGGTTCVDLGLVEAGLAVDFDEARASQVLESDIEHIVAAARQTVAQAGLRPDQLHSLYFTGGSSGLRLLSQRIAAAFPQASAIGGERFASVATGLGLYARRWFAGRDAAALTPATPPAPAGRPRRKKAPS